MTLSESPHSGDGTGTETSEPGPGPSAQVDDDATCPYCERRFARETWLALHEGQEHADRLTPDRRATIEAIREREERELRRHRLKAIGLLVLLYFGFLLTFALVR